MKKIKLHIIPILLVIILANNLTAQCDFFGTVSVQADGYTNTFGYTQQYVLVEDNAGTQGDILDITSDGNFGSLDEGSYFLYAVNYEGAQPSELAIDQTWASLDAYDQDAGNCFEMSEPYYNRAVNVCSSDDVCFGNPIEIAVENYNQDAGYELRYILVRTSDGTIVDFNDTGSFGEIDYTNSGTYDAYALSTNDATLIADLTQGMLFTDFNTLADATCAEFLGPREITVLDNNFVYVADGSSIEATAFCEVDGWTHYSTAANPHDFVFSIYKNSNDITATVHINVAETGTNYLSVAANDEYSSMTLRRSWTVDASGADYNSFEGGLSQVVKVRFYYPLAEKTWLNDIASDFLNGTTTTVNSSGYDHDFLRTPRWFKSIDGNVLDLSAMTTPELIVDAYGPTVVGDELTTTNGVNYVELADITGFSGGTFATGTGPKDNEDVLPVELLSFQLDQAKDYDLLTWSTASEKNNDYFSIEMSLDSENFKEIAKVNGASTTNIQQDYQYENYDIIPDIVYYRLKQVDFDGAYQYSKIIAGKRNVKSWSVDVYPNPYQNNLNINFSHVAKEETLTMQFFDELGKLVTLDNLDISAYNTNFNLDLSYLPEGVYTMKLISSKHTYSFKLIRKI